MSSDRICGGCTACCKTHMVAEIQKPIGKWCPECDIGKGCRIYALRPQSCQEFRCQWLAGYGGASDRPDKSKLVIDYTEIDGNEVLSIWEVTEGAINYRLAQETTRFGIEAGIPVVHVLLSGRKMVLLPDGTKRDLLPEEDRTSLLK